MTEKGYEEDKFDQTKYQYSSYDFSFDNFISPEPSRQIKYIRSDLNGDRVYHCHDQIQTNNKSNHSLTLFSPSQNDNNIYPKPVSPSHGYNNISPNVTKTQT